MEADLKSTPGIILRRHNAKGADLIIKILTKELGKITLAVRNGRSSKGKFKGGLDVFDCGVFVFNTPKKNLGNLSEIEQRKIWLELRQNLSKFSLAGLAIEATDVFTKENDLETAKLFPFLFLCLENINKTKCPKISASCLIFFLTELLKISGFDILARQNEFQEIHSVEKDGYEAEIKWFKEMRKRNAAFFPGSCEILKDSLYLLLKEIENTNGWPLNSADAAFNAFDKC